MRRDMTKAERKIRFEFLKDRPLWYKFLRQKLIWSYILDFYCSKLMLAIEIDGDTHTGEDAEVYDARRTDFLHDQWITVLRYSNEDVYMKIDEMKKDIEKKIIYREKTINNSYIQSDLYLNDPITFEWSWNEFLDHLSNLIWKKSLQSDEEK